MVDFIVPIGLLLIVLSIITVLKDNVVSSDNLTKIGIFSVVVSIIGYIFGLFEPIGMVISGISIIVLIMIISIKVYTMIFGVINDLLIRLTFAGTFITLVFQFLYLIMGEPDAILIGRNLSFGFALFCVLIKAFKLIFTKEDEENIQADITANIDQIDSETKEEIND